MFDAQKNRIIYKNIKNTDFCAVFRFYIFVFLHPNCSIAIDMSNISEIREQFLSFLKKISKKNKISLLNLSANSFALLRLRQIDRYVSIYADVNDFLQNKRVLAGRRFELV